jgi:hypothetical protein
VGGLRNKQRENTNDKKKTISEVSRLGIAKTLQVAVLWKI